jgi:hypothetical protein
MRQSFLVRERIYLSFAMCARVMSAGTFFIFTVFACGRNGPGMLAYRSLQ